MRRLLTLTCAMVLLGTVFYAEHTPLVPYFAKILGSRSRQRASGAGVLLGVRPTAFAGLGSMSASKTAFQVRERGPGTLLRLAAVFGSTLSSIQRSHGPQRGARRSEG